MQPSNNHTPSGPAQDPGRTPAAQDYKRTFRTAFDYLEKYKDIKADELPQAARDAAALAADGSNQFLTDMLSAVYDEIARRAGPA